MILRNNVKLFFVGGNIFDTQKSRTFRQIPKSNFQINKCVKHNCRYLLFRLAVQQLQIFGWRRKKSLISYKAVSLSNTKKTGLLPNYIVPYKGYVKDQHLLFFWDHCFSFILFLTFFIINWQIVFYNFG